MIRLLKNLQDNSPAAEEVYEQKVSPEKPVNEKPVIEQKRQEKMVTKPDTRRQEPVKVKDEPVRTPKKTAETVTLGDTFGKRTDSLNERLGIRKEEEDVAGHLKSKPISSLSEAIGINDRFLFIRELFNGNSELYNKTISSLENTGTFGDASSIVMNIAGNDAENKAAKQLLELVKRKFPANE